jgi:hypothetical protein
LESQKNEQPKEEVKEEVKQKEEEGPVGKCLLHPDIKIAAYCRTCDEPICTTCLLSNHDGHKKMNLEEAKPISTEEYLTILDDIKDSHSLITRFKNNLNDNMNITLKTIKEYFENIRKTLDEKESKLLSSLDSFSNSNNTILDGEIKTHTDMIKRMEDEKIFVEQLKIKIEAKKVVSDMQSNSSQQVPITYSFFKNDLIATNIGNDLDVQEGTKKIMFTNIKNGYLPLSSITIVDNSVKQEKVEEKVEEKEEEKEEIVEKKNDKYSDEEDN